MGMYFHLGAWPAEGSVFPTGIHNMIPHKVRNYIPMYDHSLVPIIWFYDHGIDVTFYLGYKAFPDQVFTSDGRKMYKAIINRDFEAMERLINNGFNINEVVLSEYGYTPLGMAASLNFVEVVHYLTIRGADYEQPNGPFKKTALHLAVEYNSELTTKFLLNNGADLKAKDSFGFTVYDKAEYRGFYDYKTIFHHFKNNPKGRFNKSYEEFKEGREIYIDKLDSFNERDYPGLYFSPSKIIEVNNIYSLASEGKNVDIDTFGVSFINLYDIEKYNNIL
jgi:hypothetical protein